MKSEKRAWVGDQPTDDVAGPDMDFDEIVLDEIGDREGHDQGPVEYPQVGIPHIRLRRSGISIRIEHERFLAF